MGYVPDALAVHLGLAGKEGEPANGVLVANVYEGSPADKSKLERYDVITKLNGKDVGSDLAGFGKSIRGHKDGDQVELTVIHNGHANDVKLSLIKRTDAPLKPKYKVETPKLESELHGLQGGMFRRGPEGWKFEKFGGGDPLKQLPENLRKQFQQWHGGIDGDLKMQMKLRRQDDDGQTIEDERKGKEIVVKRSKDGQETETKTYKSETELKKQDPDAYKMLKGIRMGSGGHAGLEALRLLELTPPNRNVVPPHSRAMRLTERATERFDVDESGRVKVHVQKGSQELTRVFKDKDEFKAKAPKLFERYQKMQD